MTCTKQDLTVVTELVEAVRAYMNIAYDEAQDMGDVCHHLDVSARLCDAIAKAEEL
jgi:hypothetical protein